MEINSDRTLDVNASKGIEEGEYNAGKSLLGNKNATGSSAFILVGFAEAHKFHSLIFAVLMSLYILTIMTNMLIILILKSDAIFNSPMYFFLMHLAGLEAFYMTVIIPKLLENLMVETTFISYIGCALQMFFFLFFGVAESFLMATMAIDRYVAICHPLRYRTIMSKNVCLVMVAGPYLCGTAVGLIHTIVTFSGKFCSSVINHFFCEVQPLLELLCGDTYSNEVLIMGVAIFAITLPFSLIILSYIGIISTICGLPSSESKYKAFSTCSSHLIVVILFYGTCSAAYLRPKSSYSPSLDKILSFSYSIVTPLLNPIIYSIRNKEIKGAVQKLWRKMMSQ
ncbi:PREDICTED: olfactory receptor 10C1-like [Gekko japonicus]|uniref:Olfactory receptor n=1 Tax=Gekko japonicus TaxID=146911 RepID=A0ABM1K9D7_GEKJA|nr:PREDICTED: olfactory receptor 10C1-like [Gekko japonicus]